MRFLGSIFSQNKFSWMYFEVGFNDISLKYKSYNRSVDEYLEGNIL